MQAHCPNAPQASVEDKETNISTSLVKSHLVAGDRNSNLKLCLGHTKQPMKEGRHSLKLQHFSSLFCVIISSLEFKLAHSNGVFIGCNVVMWYVWRMCDGEVRVMSWPLYWEPLNSCLLVIL